MEILVSIDALQSNDELLGSTILDSLQQLRFLEPRHVVHFVLCLIGNRLLGNDLAAGEPTPLYLDNLMPHARNAIVNILMRHVPPNSSVDRSIQLQAPMLAASWLASALMSAEIAGLTIRYNCSYGDFQMRWMTSMSDYSHPYGVSRALWMTVLIASGWMEARPRTRQALLSWGDMISPRALHSRQGLWSSQPDAPCDKWLGRLALSEREDSSGEIA